jgi:hypothetical protein
MKTRDGLVALSDGVRAFFAANQIPADVTPVGWKYRTFQLNQGPGGGSRVCFIPGRIDPSMPGPPKVIDAGKLSQPSTAAPPGVARAGGLKDGVRNPRPLRSWHHIVSVSIWGVDPTDTSNDELQYAATVALFEQTIQAMHFSVDPVTEIPVGMANLEHEGASWVLPPVERAFGRELVLFFVQHGPLYAPAKDVTTPQPAIIKGPIT